MVFISAVLLLFCVIRVGNAAISGKEEDGEKLRDMLVSLRGEGEVEKVEPEDLELKELLEGTCGCEKVGAVPKSGATINITQIGVPELMNNMNEEDASKRLFSLCETLVDATRKNEESKNTDLEK